jgi:hypothetical protein
VSQVIVQVPCYGYCLKRRLGIPGCKRTYQRRPVDTLEVAGLVIGMVPGMHWLAITCIKHLAHDELTSAVAGAIKQLVSRANAASVQAVDGQVPGADGLADAPAAAGSLAGAGGSAAAGHEAAVPSLPTAAGISRAPASIAVTPPAPISGASANMLRGAGRPGGPAATEAASADELSAAKRDDRASATARFNQGLGSAGGC